MRLALIGVSAVVALLSVGQVAAADGKAVYEKGCAGCHNNMAPKLGDKAAWAALNKKGADALLATVIKGKAPMPPKGGQSAATNDDLKAAVDYMMSQGK